MIPPLLIAALVLLLAAAELQIRRRAAASAGAWLTRPLPAPNTQATRIVVLGDSIAFGEGLPAELAWPALLEARLAQTHPERVWQVANAGVPGSTVADAYARFNEHVSTYKPQVLVVALGLNDCCGVQNDITNRRLAWFAAAEQSWWGRSYLLRAVRTRVQPAAPPPAAAASPEVPPDAFRSILGWLVRRGRDQGATVALMTMTPLDPASGRFSPEDLRQWGDYNTLIRETGRALDAPFIEVSHRLPGALPWQDDGVHLSAAAEAVIADRVWQALHRPGLAPALGLQAGGSNAEMAPSLD